MENNIIMKTENTYHAPEESAGAPPPSHFRPNFNVLSLRFFDPRDRTNEKKRFSEAIFRLNKLYSNDLAAVFFVEIFLRLTKKKRKESIHSPTLSRRTPFSGIHSQCDSASSHDDHNIASSVG